MKNINTDVNPTRYAMTAWHSFQQSAHPHFTQPKLCVSTMPLCRMGRVEVKLNTFYTSALLSFVVLPHHPLVTSWMGSFVGPAGSMDVTEKNNPATAWSLTNLILFAARKEHIKMIIRTVGRPACVDKSGVRPLIEDFQRRCAPQVHRSERVYRFVTCVVTTPSKSRNGSL